MKKLSFISAVILLVALMAGQAFTQYYAIYIDRDRVFENNFNLCGRTDVPIDLYVHNYACPPGDLLNGVEVYITVDTSLVQVNECLPNFVDEGNYTWCDPVYGSECTQLTPNVYRLTCYNWSFSITVPHKFGYLNVSSIGEGVTDLLVANDIGASYTDGFILDCNLASIYPDSRWVTLENLPTSCSADCNGDEKVCLSDVVIMKQEFLRDDCSELYPCQADCNGDNKVDLEDLSVMKFEFLGACPYCP